MRTSPTPEKWPAYYNSHGTASLFSKRSTAARKPNSRVSLTPGRPAMAFHCRHGRSAKDAHDAKWVQRTLPPRGKARLHTQTRVRAAAGMICCRIDVRHPDPALSLYSETNNNSRPNVLYTHPPASLILSLSLARSPSLGDCRLLLHLPPSPLTRVFRRSAASSCVFRSFGHRFVCARTLPLHRRLYAPCCHLPPIKIGDDFHLKITTRPDLPCRAPKKETPPARRS